MNHERLHSKIIIALFCISVSLSLVPTGWTQTQNVPNYPPGPDSKPQPGVPKGEVLKFSFDHSKIFPGTYRDYWVYVPVEYSPDKPACVYVNQDGLRYEAPTVFDNLIYKKEMPVTIGVFVMHGRVLAKDANAALDRFNRSYEYDGLGDNYVRFLLDELLPEVETKKATDGRPIRLSHNGNDRAIGGESSGAICAFTAAWERPDAFTRVFSAIGTYVGLRGGDRYSTLIRKFEPKPIRIFMQDGSNDLNIYGGDWWMANQTMERALEFAGYEVQHVWGEGSHSGNHATAIFPDAMRFLWKDWPEPVKAGTSKNATLVAILIPGEGWKLATEGYTRSDGIAANAKGEMLLNDPGSGGPYLIGLDGEVGEFVNSWHRAKKQAFGPDGKFYAVVSMNTGTRERISSRSEIMALDLSGKQTRIAEGISGEGIVVAHNGNAYVTEFHNESSAGNPPGAEGDGRIWLVKPDGTRQIAAAGVGYPTGVALSPDQTLLYVADSRSHWVYSFQIQSDGSLQYKQRYYWLHVPDDADDSGADGMCVDREGRLYIATRLGIQICDQAGRVNCIIPTPNGKVTSLCFGGEKFDTLFATCTDRVYKRKLNAIGANAWAEPTRPAPPKL